MDEYYLNTKLGIGRVKCNVCGELIVIDQAYKTGHLKEDECGFKHALYVCKNRLMCRERVKNKESRGRKVMKNEFD